MFSLSLLTPFNLMTYALPTFPYEYSNQEYLQEFQWYNLPVGANFISLVGLSLLICGLATYWVWQGLKRCFRNPNSTILSKRQSYWLMFCFEVIILGFLVQEKSGYGSSWPLNLFLLTFFTSVMLLGFIAMLSPHRQSVQDWARYQAERSKQEIVRKKRFSPMTAAWGDWIESEHSPALVAIAINLVIAATPFMVWIGFFPEENSIKTQVLFGVAFFVSLMMIYAVVAQLMLMMKTPKRSLWAFGTIGTAIVLPPIILGLFGVVADRYPHLWLFSTFPWAGIEKATMNTMFVALLGEWTVLALLTFQLRKQLQKAGESATKSLFAERPSLPHS